MNFQAIESAGMSQREFAELVGFSRPTVNQWMNGRVRPSSAHRAIIVRAIKSIELFVEKGALPQPRGSDQRAEYLTALAKHLSRQSKTK